MKIGNKVGQRAVVKYDSIKNKTGYVFKTITKIVQESPFVSAT